MAFGFNLVPYPWERSSFCCVFLHVKAFFLKGSPCSSLFIFLMNWGGLVLEMWKNFLIFFLVSLDSVLLLISSIVEQLHFKGDSGWSCSLLPFFGMSVFFNYVMLSSFSHMWVWRLAYSIFILFLCVFSSSTVLAHISSVGVLSNFCFDKLIFSNSNCPFESL